MDIKSSFAQLILARYLSEAECSLDERTRLEKILVYLCKQFGVDDPMTRYYTCLDIAGSPVTYESMMQQLADLNLISLVTIKLKSVEKTATIPVLSHTTWKDIKNGNIHALLPDE